MSIGVTLFFCFYRGSWAISSQMIFSYIAYTFITMCKVWVKCIRTKTHTIWIYIIVLNIFLCYFCPFFCPVLFWYVGTCKSLLCFENLTFLWYERLITILLSHLIFVLIPSSEVYVQDTFKDNFHFLFFYSFLLFTAHKFAQAHRSGC